jgi:hypothetical protein
VSLRGVGGLAVRAGQTGRRVQVGLVAWDGDRNLTGDELRLGSAPLGPADNIVSGSSFTAAECGKTPARCRWNSLGTDVALYSGTVGRSPVATLSAGDDPFEVGVLAIASAQ